MRRTGVRATGAAVLVLGVLTGVVLWIAAGRRYDDAVSDLAPVPIGCTTTLEFDRPGTYTFFVETRGSVDEIDGDCLTDDRSYDVDDDDAPRVSLALVDEGGDAVDLDRADGPSYDRAGRRGAGVRTVDIDDTGEYELTATTSSADTEILVRVGQDPASGVTALRVAGLVTSLVGVGVGLLLLLVLGRRRAAPVPAAAPGPQWPVGDAGRTAPLAPPTTNPPSAPPYAPRPASHGGLPYPEAAEEWRRPAQRPPGGWPGSGGPLPPPSTPR